MFATLSPDNKYVGYVRENNIYVESVLDDEIIQLTTGWFRNHYQWYF